MNDAQTLRIIVFKEGDVYVAQCLDVDVCTAAASMDCLRDRMDALLDLELQVSKESGQAIDPAPERFHKMWEHATIQADGGKEYRMAA